MIPLMLNIEGYVVTGRVGSKHAATLIAPAVPLDVRGKSQRSMPRSRLHIKNKSRFQLRCRSARHGIFMCLSFVTQSSQFCSLPRIVNDRM